MLENIGICPKCLKPIELCSCCSVCGQAECVCDFFNDEAEIEKDDILAAAERDGHKNMGNDEDDEAPNDKLGESHDGHKNMGNDKLGESHDSIKEDGAESNNNESTTQEQGMGQQRPQNKLTEKAKDKVKEKGKEKANELKDKAKNKIKEHRNPGSQKSTSPSKPGEQARTRGQNSLKDSKGPSAQSKPGKSPSKAGKTGENAGKKAGQEAGKKAGKEAGKKAGKEAGKEVAKKAGQEGAKTAGKALLTNPYFWAVVGVIIVIILIVVIAGKMFNSQKEKNSASQTNTNVTIGEIRNASQNSASEGVNVPNHALMYEGVSIPSELNAMGGKTGRVGEGKISPELHLATRESLSSPKGIPTSASQHYIDSGILKLHPSYTPYKLAQGFGGGMSPSNIPATSSSVAHGGAFAGPVSSNSKAPNFLTSKEEHWYMNMRWDYKSAPPSWYKKRYVLVQNTTTGKYLACKVGDWGPGVDKRIGGLSYESVYYLSNQKCTIGYNSKIKTTSAGADADDYKFWWITDDKWNYVGPVGDKTTINDVLVTDKTAKTILASLKGKISNTRYNVLAEAFKYIGLPYVWGGTTPSGFDCSGLTQYVYRKNGITIPRTSRAQAAAGDTVSNTYPRGKLSKGQLQPGDLVFFSYGASSSISQIHHVGIYVGKNTNGEPLYVQSPCTGRNVCISSMNGRSDFWGGASNAALDK